MAFLHRLEVKSRDSGAVPLGLVRWLVEGGAGLAFLPSIGATYQSRLNPDLLLCKCYLASQRLGVTFTQCLRARNCDVFGVARVM